MSTQGHLPEVRRSPHLIYFPQIFLVAFLFGIFHHVAAFDIIPHEFRLFGIKLTVAPREPNAQSKSIVIPVIRSFAEDFYLLAYNQLSIIHRVRVSLWRLLTMNDTCVGKVLSWHPRVKPLKWLTGRGILVKPNCPFPFPLGSPLRRDSLLGSPSFTRTGSQVQKFTRPGK